MLLLIVLLVLTGIASGIVGTAAGLASLISYPALLALGLPPISANVTSTFGNTFSNCTAVLASLKELKGHSKEVWKFTPITVVGCIVGALLLFAFPASVFAKIVPFFILVAAVLVLLPGSKNSSQHHSPWIVALSWSGLFFTGIYSGYFGAASGVLLLGILGVITTNTLPVYNAEKNFICTFANLISLIVYAMKTSIRWSYVIPIVVGYVIGGYIGPIIVRHVPARIVKILVGIGALILASTLFYQAYFE